MPSVFLSLSTWASLPTWLGTTTGGGLGLGLGRRVPAGAPGLVQTLGGRESWLSPCSASRLLPLFLSVTCFMFLSRLWGSEGSHPQWQQIHWGHVPFLLPRRPTLPLGIRLGAGRPVVVTASLELYSQPSLAALGLDGIKEPLASTSLPTPPCSSPGLSELGGG